MKKAFIEKNGQRQWICEYKNCRQEVAVNKLYCQKHIDKLKKQRELEKMHDEISMSVLNDFFSQF